MLGQNGVLFLQRFQGGWTVAKLSEADTTWVLTIFALSLIILGVATMHYRWIQKSI